MTQQEIDELFDANVQEINKLSTGPAHMIKALIMGIESNGPAYIRLFDAEDDGNRVSYEHVEGDAALVSQVGSALGLIVGDSTLETRSA